MTLGSWRAATLVAALGIAAGSSAQGVTTLNIDTRDTGVDLGLQHNADGSISAKLPPGVRVPALDNGISTATTAPGGMTTGVTGTATDVDPNVSAPGALGTSAADRAPPGTSTFGNPTSAGRVNGNSGTNNGRSTPNVTGGSGIVNSGTPGNGLNGAATGTTGAGPAATGTTGAGGVATGNTGNATAGAAVDAATAAQAASNSRSVSGPITGSGARILNRGGANGNGRGSGTGSTGSAAGGSSTSAARAAGNTAGTGGR
ncbi:MAG TPA: hypothetical protein VLR71_00795 [Casimicrobiaceae bacterium]|nr:hypothetical protein [Casimicrobiaceae bacterium]